MASLLTAPTTQLVDGNGNPLSGGKVYTYVTGASLAPKAAYTTASATTPLSNPVILDSTGSAEIWLSGSYRIRVFSASDVLLYDVDDVSADASSTTTFTDSAFEIVDDLDATKKIKFQLSGLTTATTRTYTAPDKNGTLALLSDISGSVNYYQVTDSTDLALSNVPTQTNVGTTKSINIPTKGLIALNFSGQLISAGTFSLILGIRIGSTNYWPSYTSAVPATVYHVSATQNAGTWSFASSGVITTPTVAGAGSLPVFLDIEALSIPTGTQTVQVIAAQASTLSSITIKGTVQTTRINITVTNNT